MQSKQSREEDVTDAARIELFQVLLMSFSVGSIQAKAKKKNPRPQIGLSVSHNRPATNCRGEVIRVCIHLVQSFKALLYVCELHDVKEGLKHEED